ncbi:hypothetical protein OK016_27795 [Vibrio chagasii]|nr:hypothetical protein [Vibrio chagasii]
MTCITNKHQLQHAVADAVVTIASINIVLDKLGFKSVDLIHNKLAAVHATPISTSREASEPETQNKAAPAMLQKLADPTFEQ